MDEGDESEFSNSRWLGIGCLWFVQQLIRSEMLIIWRISSFRCLFSLFSSWTCKTSVNNWDVSVVALIFMEKSGELIRTFHHNNLEDSDTFNVFSISLAIGQSITAWYAISVAVSEHSTRISEVSFSRSFDHFRGNWFSVKRLAVDITASRVFMSHYQRSMSPHSEFLGSEKQLPHFKRRALWGFDIWWWLLEERLSRTSSWKTAGGRRRRISD